MAQLVNKNLCLNGFFAVPGCLFFFGWAFVLGLVLKKVTHFVCSWERGQVVAKAKDSRIKHGVTLIEPRKIKPLTFHYTPYGSNHLLKMVMEPKYLTEEVIIHPNHHLTR